MMEAIETATAVLLQQLVTGKRLELPHYTHPKYESASK